MKLSLFSYSLTILGSLSAKSNGVHLIEDNESVEQNETELSQTGTNAEAEAFSEALLNAYSSSCSQNALQNLHPGDDSHSKLLDFYAQLDDVTPLSELAQVESGTEKISQAMQTFGMLACLGIGYKIISDFSAAQNYQLFGYHNPYNS